MHAFELYYRDILSKMPSDVKAEWLAYTEFVDINNVAEYFYNTEKENWDFDLDFPCVAPPWPCTWMEFQLPKAHLVALGLPPIKGHMGAAIIGLEIDPEKGQEALRADVLTMWLQSSLDKVESSKKLAQEPGWSDKAQQAIDQGLTARWGIFISVYSTYQNKISPFFSGLLYLDNQGAILSDLVRYANYSTYIQNVAERDMSPILPFLYALQFLHCKNVETIKAPIRRSIRRRMKKRGVPDIIFKQLVVHAMGPKRIPEDDTEHMLTGIKQRLHICRGHFKDYRQGKGLFGRIRGIFWWAQQARGSVEKGIVLKDYKLDTDQ